MTEYDVAIVGASVGGCTAAKLYGERGARVALIEKRPDPAAYKTVCTHYIQSSATPVIEKLGLARALDERGANHNSVDMWTPYGGWIRGPDDDTFGYSVTRRTLDPLLRAAAAETPGVDLMTGRAAAALTGDGLTLKDGAHVRARLVVGADGRGSAVARMAGLPGRVKPHNRFFYWAYWRGVEPASERSRMWFMEPDCAYTFPNEDGLTVVLAGPHRDRLPEFRADLEGAYHRFVAALPDGPRLDGATRESKMIGKLDLPNVLRRAARGSDAAGGAVPVALVGDAALASDPLWGVGCGWAFQSADWLVEETADALTSGGDLDAALDRYRRLHFRRLAPHHLMIADIASARSANRFERMMYRAAARDPEATRAMAEVGSRTVSPARVLRPGTLARIVRAGAAA
ncbi:MAG TPA: NAD(P)/FAD-dependent oxidoreductase [Solirubrobacteraceae bacterium]|nr:NAD(P)/FAD-dependent oxidoreductase [Solirubrobacteraceae bacterium]